MKVGIVIITYNISPEITILQVEAIRKFCKDDFVIEIIDNSSDMDIAKDLQYHCEVLGLSYRKTYATSFNGTDSHCFAAQSSYQLLKTKYNCFAYMDHDLIPVRSFSILGILGDDKVIAGLGQGSMRKYLWAGLVFWRNDKIDNDLIDFSPSHDLGLDSGGNLYKIIEKYGEEKCIFFDEAYYQNPDYTGKEYKHYAMINNGMFMHFVNSSGWNKVENNAARLNSLLNIAREKINNYVD